MAKRFDEGAMLVEANVEDAEAAVGGIEAVTGFDAEIDGAEVFIVEAREDGPFVERIEQGRAIGEIGVGLWMFARLAAHTGPCSPKVSAA